MTSRARTPRAAALLALIALLHLALPIAAASADCSPTGLGGESCCCAHDDDTDGDPAAAPAVDSCCGGAPEDAPVVPAEDECHCHAVPSPDPLGPVDAPEPPRFERVESALAPAPADLPDASAAPTAARTHARARPPGRARAERLWWRVFRL